MCLTLTEDATSQKAVEDIIVYKHIIWDIDRYVTSYQNSPVIIGKTYKSHLHLIENKAVSCNDSRRVIERGLHSFINLEHAAIIAKQWHEQLVKCKIPKGSIYWEGTFATFGLGDAPCYASDTLTYIEILPY